MSVSKVSVLERVDCKGYKESQFYKLYTVIVANVSHTLINCTCKNRLGFSLEGANEGTQISVNYYFFGQISVNYHFFANSQLTTNFG